MKRLSLRTRLIATSLGLMIALLATGHQSYAQDAEPALSLASNQGLNTIVILSPNGRETHPTAPVILKIRLYKGSDAARFRALLNGADVTAKFERINRTACISSACDLTASVLPSDGLVRGLNKLTVEVTRVDFTRDQATRNFSVAGPKANAGPDRTGKVGSLMKLDGSGSVTATASVNHAWTLIERPNGSQVTLNESNSVAPGFVPDVTGTYIAQLIVGDGHFLSDPDTVRIVASTSALLIPVQTGLCCAADGSYSIRIGDKVYASGNDAGVNQAGFQMLALNSASLELIEQRAFPTGSGASFAPIQAFFDNRQLGEIVIVSATASSGNFNKELGAILMGTSQVPGFGGNNEIAEQAPNSDYSFIGVKGYNADQAFQTGFRASDFVGYFTQDVKGTYRYFQRDFVKFQIKDPSQPDTITVGNQTVIAPSLNGAQGGFQVTAFDRLRLLRLPRPETSDPLNEIYLTGDITNGASEVSRMADDLNGLFNYYGENALFVISSVGNPLPYKSDLAVFGVRNRNLTTNHGNIFITCSDANGATVEASSDVFVLGHNWSGTISASCPATSPSYTNKWRWTHTGSGDEVGFLYAIKGIDNQTGQTELASIMSRIGANPHVIANMGPNDTYSLIGSLTPAYKGAPPAAFVESSSVITTGVPAGGIRGLLGRNHRFYYEPILSDIDLSTPISHDMQIVAWQDPVDWPYSQTAGERAAYAYLSQKAACGNASPDGPNPCRNSDIRAAYTNTLSDPSIWNTNVSGASYPVTTLFTQEDFNNVSQQLILEFGYVSRVYQFHNQAQQLFTAVNSNNQNYLKSIAQEVIDASKTPPTSPVAINVLKALGGLSQLVSAAIPVPAAKAVAGVLGAVFNTAANLVNTPGGSAQAEVDTTVGNLSADAAASFDAMNSAVGQLTSNLVTDWGKLQYVGSRIASNDPGWVWEVNNDTLGYLETSLRSHYYERLSPIVFQSWQVLNDVSTGLDDYVCPNKYANYYPYEDRPENAYGIYASFPTDSRTNQGWDNFTFARWNQTFEDKSLEYPSFLGTLFNPYNIGGLSLSKINVLTRWKFTAKGPCPPVSSATVTQ